MLINVVLLLAAVVVSAGCGQSTTAGDDALLTDDSIVAFAFHDSSVPPEYHRSVALVVSKDESRIVIDSYGEVLADESVPTPAAVWTQLAETIDEVSGLSVTNEAEGCAGGTSVDLTVSDGDARLVDLAPQFCGGTNETVGAAIDAWIAPARDLFPHTAELAPEGS